MRKSDEHTKLDLGSPIWMFIRYYASFIVKEEREKKSMNWAHYFWYKEREVNEKDRHRSWYPVFRPGRFLLQFCHLLVLGSVFRSLRLGFNSLFSWFLYHVHIHGSSIWTSLSQSRPEADWQLIHSYFYLSCLLLSRRRLGEPRWLSRKQRTSKTINRNL